MPLLVSQCLRLQLHLPLPWKPPPPNRRICFRFMTVRGWYWYKGRYHPSEEIMSENVDRLSVGSRIRQILLSPTVGPFIALLVAAVFFTTRTDRFLSGPNISLIFQQSG